MSVRASYLKLLTTLSLGLVAWVCAPALWAQEDGNELLADYLSRATQRIYEGAGIIRNREISGTQEGLRQTLHQIFERDLTVRDWPFHMRGLETVIRRVRYQQQPPEILFDLEVRSRANNEPLTQECVLQWHTDGHEVFYYISDIEVAPEARHQPRPLGRQIVQRQLDFARRQTPHNGVIELQAVEVGTYNWAQLGFHFTYDHLARNLRSEFQRFLEQQGVHLTEQQLALFQQPYHFAAFDAGIYVVRHAHDNVELPLTVAQRRTGTLTGMPNGEPLNAHERATGRTSRMALPLGKAFLLQNRSWAGRIRMAGFEGSEAQRYAQAVATNRSEAVNALSPAYQQMIRDARAQRMQRAQSQCGDLGAAVNQVETQILQRSLIR